MVRLSCAGPIVSFRSQLRHCHPWRGLTTQLSPGPHLAELGVTFESRFACAKSSMPGRAEQLRASRIRGSRLWRDLTPKLSPGPHLAELGLTVPPAYPVPHSPCPRAQSNCAILSQ